MLSRGAKVVAMMMAAAVFLVGCGSGGLSLGPSDQSNGVFSTKASHGGTLITALTGSVRSLDPSRLTDASTAMVMKQVYQTLVRLSRKDGTAKAGAASYTVSSDGLTYTFKLKSGLKFSNGDPVTAANVKASLDRITSYNASGHGPSPDGFLYANIQGYNAWFNGGRAPARATTGLAGVVVTGTRTLQITLKKPQSAFIDTLALASASILDATSATKGDTGTALQQAVGSGPFRVLSASTDHAIVLAPNSTYVGTKPYVHRLVIEQGVPYRSQLIQFEQGRLDVLLGPIDASSYATVQKSKPLRALYHAAPQNSVTYLAFNTTNSPFNRTSMRLAVNYALDKKQIARTATAGRAQIASQPLPPTLKGYNSHLKPIAYNPSTAKTLLAGAGYKMGKEPPLRLIYPEQLSGAPVAVRMIQKQLQQVGFNVQVQGFKHNRSYWQYEENPKNPWSLAFTSWSQDYPDAQDFLVPLLAKQSFGSTNVGNWTDTSFQHLLETADVLPSSQASKQQSLYEQAESIAHKKAAWAFLYYGFTDALIQPWIGPADTTVYVSPMGGPEFRLMWTNRTSSATQ